jgi:hypothetical protein
MMSDDDRLNDGLVDLQDLNFDFEDYFKRYHDGNMSEDEKRDFSARVYGMFCRDFFNSSSDPGAVKPWVAKYLAEKLWQVLGGVPWQDIMNMPWDVPTPFFTPIGQRAFGIYAGVENTLHDTPDANVTDLIVEQARKHNVSYQTARTDYYDMRKGIKSKTGIPAKFLIRSGES